MEKYDSLKQTHEQEYARLAIDLYNCNERRDLLMKRMKELELILATIEHLRPEEKPE